jgi:hypothetical protein
MSAKQISEIINSVFENPTRETLSSYLSLLKQELSTLSTDKSSEKYDQFVLQFNISEVTDFLLQKPEYSFLLSLLLDVLEPFLQKRDFFNSLLEPMIWNVLKKSDLRWGLEEIMNQHIDDSPEFVKEHLENILEVACDFKCFRLLPHISKYYGPYKQRIQKEFGKLKELLKGNHWDCHVTKLQELIRILLDIL